MGKRKQRHSDEFKREAVKLLKLSGKTLHQQARELGVDPSTLWSWREKIDHELDGPSVGDGAEIPGESLESALLKKDEEVRRLKREMDVLREERDFLKKATAFFAKGSQ